MGMWARRLSLAVAVLSASLLLLFPAGAGASEEEAAKLTAAEGRLSEAQQRAATAKTEMDALAPELKSARREAAELSGDFVNEQKRLDDATSALNAERDDASQQIARAQSAYEAEIEAWHHKRALWAGVAAFAFVGAIGLGLWKRLEVSILVGWLLKQDVGVQLAAFALPLITLLTLGLVLFSSASAGASIVGGLTLGAGVAATLVGIGVVVGALAIVGRVQLPKRGSRAATARRAMGMAAIAAAVAALLISATASEPALASIPPGELALANAGSAEDNPTPEVEALKRRADAAALRAQRARDHRDALAAKMAHYGSQLANAESDIHDAQKDVGRWEAALAKADPVPKSDAAPPTPDPEEGSTNDSSGCDPNYSGCVPPYPPDVNCDEVAGPVDVLGDDPHGLDADNDGVGCES